MRITLVIVIIVLAFAGSLAGRHWLNRGTPVSGSDQNPHCGRLVCMSPGITETVFALGLGDQVVGVTRFCLYPPEATTRPSVGGLLDPNYEALVALQPDLVLLTPFHRDQQGELTRLGLAWQVVPQDTLAEIRESFETLGALCGRETEAAALVSRIDERLRRIREQTKDCPPVRTLLTTGRDVRSGVLNEVYAVGPGAFLSELLEAAGGENIAPGRGAEYPALSAEGILRLNPDVIIELAPDVQVGEDLMEKALAPWKFLVGLSAVHNQRVYLLGGTHLTIPGPRLTDTLEAFARLLHPDLDWDDL